MSIFAYSRVSVGSARKLFEYIVYIRCAAIIFLVVFLGSNKFKYVAPRIAMNIWALLSVHAWWAEVFLLNRLVVAG